MNIEQVRQRTNNGIKPFEIRLSDGRRVLVPHPDFVALGLNVIVVIGENDRIITIDAHHIVSIEEEHS
jgi:hypothetical protein